MAFQPPDPANDPVVGPGVRAAKERLAAHEAKAAGPDPDLVAEYVETMKGWDPDALDAAYQQLQEPLEEAPEEEVA